MKKTIFENDTNFFKSTELDEHGLLKAKKMPIGTVSKGKKKVAEGKWVPVKGEKESKKGGVGTRAERAKEKVIETLTSREALKVDKSFYVDEEGGIKYIFGDNSGFAYSEVNDEEDGKEKIKALKKMVKKK